MAFMVPFMCYEVLFCVCPDAIKLGEHSKASVVSAVINVGAGLMP